MITFLVESIAEIVLFSPSLPSKLVDAIEISSPTCQSTSSDKVMTVPPAYTVVSSVVQVGVLTGPCMSRVPYLTPITLFP